MEEQNTAVWQGQKVTVEIKETIETSFFPAWANVLKDPHTITRQPAMGIFELEETIKADNYAHHKIGIYWNNDNWLVLQQEQPGLNLYNQK